MSNIQTSRVYVSELKENYKSNGEITDTAKIDKLKNIITADAKITEEELSDVKDLLKSINYKESDGDPVSEKINILFKDMINTSKTDSSVIEKIKNLKEVFSENTDPCFIRAFNDILKHISPDSDIRDLFVDSSSNESMSIIKKVQGILGLPQNGKIDPETKKNITMRGELKQQLNSALRAFGVNSKIEFPDDKNLSQAVKFLQKELDIDVTGNFKDASQMKVFFNVLNNESSFRANIKNKFNEYLSEVFQSPVKIDNLSIQELNKGLHELQHILGLRPRGDIKDAMVLQELDNNISKYFEKLNNQVSHKDPDKETFVAMLEKANNFLYLGTGDFHFEIDEWSSFQEEQKTYLV